MKQEIGPIGPPRRSKTRYEISRPVKLKRAAWPEYRPAVCKNVAEGGLLLLVSDDPPAVGERVVVKLGQAFGSPPPQAPAKVVRVEGYGAWGWPVAVVLLGIGANRFVNGLLGARARRNAMRASEKTGEISLDSAELGEGWLIHGETPTPAEVELGESADPPDVAGSFGRLDLVGSSGPDSTIGVNELARALSSAGAAGSGEAHTPDPRLTPAPASAVSPAIIGRADSPAVGLDFGTTHSKVAVFDGDKVCLLHEDDSAGSDRSAVPSAVYYRRNEVCCVGEQARSMLAVDPHHVITSIKRVMGLGYSDPLANGLLGSLACPSRRGPNDSILFRIGQREVTVPEVCASVLKHMAGMASGQLGSEVKRAVLTIPVEFDLRARRHLSLAAKMAGIDVIAMLPEPLAATIGSGHRGQPGSTVAVYDFGGGTLDVSVLQYGGLGMAVRGAAGDRWLGGDDLDEVLARQVAVEFHRATGLKLRGRAAWQRLVFACEEAKRRLSSMSATDVIVPRAARTGRRAEALLVRLDRNDFREFGRDVVASSLEVCEQALGLSGVRRERVGSLLLTGGTTRIPFVCDEVERFFGIDALVGPSPEHSVVIGAALHAATLTGVELPDDLQQALVMFGGRRAQPIGLAMADGSTDRLFEGTEPLPAAAHRVYSTSRDGQRACRIEVVAGRSTRTCENRPVGQLVVDGLPPAAAGVVSLDVYFELDCRPRLRVKVVERSTGQQVKAAFDVGAGCFRELHAA